MSNAAPLVVISASERGARGTRAGARAARQGLIAARRCGAACEDPRHRGRGLHRISYRQGPARARRRGGRHRQPQRLLRSEAQGGAPRDPASATAKFRFAKLDIADRPAMQALFDARAVRARRASRGAGRRALLDPGSAPLRAEQHHRLPARARGLPPQGVGTWSTHRPVRSMARTPACRSSRSRTSIIR